jgi:hypothetical protein
MTAMLPAEFADLEPLAARWCLPDEPARYAARVSSTMEELQELYDAVFPRAEAALEYLDRFSLDELTDDALHLLQLLYALVIVSFAVEAWRQPRIPDTGAAELHFTIEPVP